MLVTEACIVRCDIRAVVCQYHRTCSAQGSEMFGGRVDLRCTCDVAISGVVPAITIDGLFLPIKQTDPNKSN